MNIRTVQKAMAACRLSILLILIAPLCFYQSALAAPAQDGAHPAAAALKLVQSGLDARAGLDTAAVAGLIDYVLGAKPSKETELPIAQKAPGAYYEFDTKIGFADFLQYSYSCHIPAVLTSPSSLRYSLWNGLPGKTQKLPSSWTSIPRDGKPIVIRGLQRDAITPDLTTGVYYEYNLNRTFILLNHKGRQALVTISKQANVSDVGKKGFILGNDDDWNYYYSGEPGSARTGLGWVKSYIYDYFSVAVYVEAGGQQPVVRTGIFQWIRAGWNGMNFVQTEHILKGMKRYAKNSKVILESPNLPEPSQVAQAYQRLSSLPHSDLLDKYAALQQARQSLAVQSGKIETSKIKKQDSYAGIPKEQILEELMLEYLKIVLGKSTLLSKKVAMGLI